MGLEEGGCMWPGSRHSGCSPGIVCGGDQVLCRPHNLLNCQLSISPYYPDLLGRLSNRITQQREIVQEQPTTIPNTLNMQQNGNQDNDRKVPRILEIDKLVVQGNLCDKVEESQDNTPCPEGSDEMSTPRTPHSSDTDKGEDLGHLSDPLIMSNSWEYETRRAAASDPSNSLHEAEVVMEAAELSFMQKYHHELLAEMDNVTIFPLEEDDKFGFKVLGNTVSCNEAVELLQHIVSSLPSRTFMLEYPWVSHFLLESEGQRTLRDTEKQHQCIIDTSQISLKVLDNVNIDPWSYVHDTSSVEEPSVQSMMIDEVAENSLLGADIEGIKKFASLLGELPNNINESSTVIGQNIHGKDSEEDLYTDRSTEQDDSTTSEEIDEELDQICQISRKEYQEQQLDEEAQLLLAIQRSMDTQGVSTQKEEEELQRALEMSLIQQSDDTADFMQKVLEMSFKEHRAHDYNEPMRMLEDPASTNLSETTSDVAQIRILAGDETCLVVAATALRKAITSKLNAVTLEVTGDVPNISQILDALEKKHKVRITKDGKEHQIQGFLQCPSQCRREISQIFNALQATGQAKAHVIDVDIDRDVEILDVPETSEEYQHVIQPFLKTLRDQRQSIEVLQVQKVQNALLYNQYMLKKLRMVMTDPNKPAERILYHGTTEASAREICHSGFNRSFCGKNAALYGQGVYFAAESVLSTRNHYSPPNGDGKKFVLVSRVLTGEFTQGKENMRTPPTMSQNSGGAPRRYDSLVDNMRKPTIYVIFNDTQAYPEYLITCRNHTPGSSMEGSG
uniref:Poly [ADP-ribose] polymerase n=1 Tax=Pyxicephalus adspersus TaxID=30357 RepID=A0AAV3ALJ6_PYXAD|nr:TPA: hypothetical protein GDO54_011582 [Pyxicephalus adspersus]